jgi:hypothetical protein
MSSIETKRAKRDAKLALAAKDPVLDNMGKINLSATCTKFNLSKNHDLKQLLLGMVDPALIKQHIKYNGQVARARTGTSITLAGLPFGEKTIALGWDVIQQPAVYAIVCKTTGRAFISSSIHPDKQRNVHFYWMQNWFKYGNSNTFFGNKKFIEDFKAYGIKDFCMEIVESHPGLTSAQVHKKSIEFLELHGLENCYNRWLQTAYAGLMCQFYDIDEEVKAATDAYHELKIVYESLIIEHRIVHQNTIESRRKLRRELRDCRITVAEFNKFNTSLTDIIKVSRSERDTAGARMDISKASLKVTIAKKKKFYKANTEPF